MLSDIEGGGNGGWVQKLLSLLVESLSPYGMYTEMNIHAMECNRVQRASALKAMEQLASIYMLIPMVIPLRISCILMVPKSQEIWEIQ